MGMTFAVWVARVNILAFLSLINRILEQSLTNNELNDKTMQAVN